LDEVDKSIRETKYESLLRMKCAELSSLKRLGLAGHQWLTPVILATQETEIRRIAV
jgi:hypothetical protein